MSKGVFGAGSSTMASTFTRRLSYLHDEGASSTCFAAFYFRHYSIMSRRPSIMRYRLVRWEMTGAANVPLRAYWWRKPVFGHSVWFAKKTPKIAISNVAQEIRLWGNPPSNFSLPDRFKSARADRVIVSKYCVLRQPCNRDLESRTPSAGQTGSRAAIINWQAVLCIPTPGEPTKLNCAGLAGSGTVPRRHSGRLG